MNVLERLIPTYIRCISESVLWRFEWVFSSQYHQQQSAYCSEILTVIDRLNILCKNDPSTNGYDIDFGCSSICELIQLINNLKSTSPSAEILSLAHKVEERTLFIDFCVMFRSKYIQYKGVNALNMFDSNTMLNSFKCMFEKTEPKERFWNSDEEQHFKLFNVKYIEEINQNVDNYIGWERKQRFEVVKMKIFFSASSTSITNMWMVIYIALNVVFAYAMFVWFPDLKYIKAF